MKEFWSIPGPSKAPHLPCLAFKKYDGNCMRFEWSRKRGWYKFGTRTQIIDEKNKDFGNAIAVFMATQADPIAKAFADARTKLPSFDSAVVFGEYVGPQSFAGQHVKNDNFEIVLFDVNLHKRGFVLPRDFVKYFGHLRSAEVVWEGVLGQQFIEEVKNNKYGENEGVVCKGVNAKEHKSEQHGLWMAKVKTGWWLNELKRRALEDPIVFKRALEENLTEQEGQCTTVQEGKLST